ncbi:putative bifunctional fatty acid transporter/acyl-CoA synthetase [Bisporella sp. PMI_857]|nr:putative bifunctional fatty acid transporter/acyl-CoA synthetase [Bisporella sp. PMI_857]
MAAVPLLSAAAVAAGAYVNAKLSIGTDLQQLSYDRELRSRLEQRIKSYGDTCTLYHMFDLVNPDNEALWFEGKTWTYGELKREVHRFSHFLSEKGIQDKEIVAVFTTNSPEMYVTALALSKLGAVAALINTNLRDETFRHCLDVSTAKTIISTPDLSEFMTEPIQHFSVNLSTFTDIVPANSQKLEAVNISSLPTPSTITPAAKATIRDLALLVYTSGTTGKPKACGCRNHLLMITSNAHPRDVRNSKKYFPLRTYSPLPLFHGTAFFTGISYCIGTSSTLCLARKFSASRFWKDVHDSKATRVLYVGELCRYLMAAPPSPYDRGHNCIVASGNGLRGEIWEKFRERFGVPEIREFYRSTEGTAKYDNIGVGAAAAGKVGFAGFIGQYMENDTFLVKTDPVTGEIYRNPKTGFCTVAGADEPGECIGRVKDPALLMPYLNNEAATEATLLRDVFVKGDLFRRMGDLLVRESSGWIHFHDRLGDTFRWKGENVSAGEVRDHIAKLPEVQDAVVYGVKLASYDGQAGAASITLDSQSEANFMSVLFKALKKTGLPNYAMPRLVRITKEIEANATFKKAKGDLQKKSWDESAPGNTDKLYWLNGSVYERLDRASWGSIESGKAKL